MSWLLLIFVGCGLSEAEYVERLAAADCAWLQSCHPETFHERYDDVAACEARLADLTASAADVVDCPYDAGAASACLRDRDGRGCEEDVTCQDVWACE